MKLATLRKGGRDGALAVVNRTLALAIEVPDIAPTLQAALDDWANRAPALARVSDQLNAGTLGGAFAFDPGRAAAPLPRAYQWVDGSAYVNHIELVRKARGAPMPASLWTEPIMYQGGSDTFLGPRDPIPVANEAGWGADFEAELAVIVDDVPLAASRAQAAAAIRLIVLLNDVSLRGLIPDELAKGFGFLHGKPSTAFAPVAITPDELGSAWDGTKVGLPLCVDLNGARIGAPHAGIDMTFDFPALIVHAAKTRALSAGTIVGAGTVSNRDRAKGVCCLAEKRVLETLDTGAPITPFLRHGDFVRIEVRADDGQSVFGSIEQRVVPLTERGNSRSKE
ncbi:MAG TPA: fumarylacetoacetate hydrolase family protein [Vineibacter sp.]|nr:fumarylacetoacetate hydrolase family protein [Vineibacter sp.]